jgi:hypothetical protein
MWDSEWSRTGKPDNDGDYLIPIIQRTDPSDDAVFRPQAEIREAAVVVAEELGLPVDWLNDGVKGFLSHSEELSEEPIADLEGLPNLRIIWPTAEYLLALKCMAARADGQAEDRGDVAFLIRSLGLRSEEEVFGIVERFYPSERIHVKTRYFVGEIIAEMAEKPDGAGGGVKI